MNKALLPLLLCCFIFPASGKDAGWQWYNGKRRLSTVWQILKFLRE